MFIFIFFLQIGKSDPTSFPIQKKRASREFLRTVAHLRPRTNTFGAVCSTLLGLLYWHSEDFKSCYFDIILVHSSIKAHRFVNQEIADDTFSFLPLLTHPEIGWNALSVCVISSMC
jgi:hypothetical protein